METQERLMPRDLAFRSRGALGLEGPPNTSQQGLTLFLLPRHLITLEHSLPERSICWKLGPMEMSLLRGIAQTLM